MTQLKLQPLARSVPAPGNVHRSAVPLKTRPLMHWMNGELVWVPKLSVYGPVNGPTDVIWPIAAPAAANRVAEHNARFRVCMRVSSSMGRLARRRAGAEHRAQPTRTMQRPNMSDVTDPPGDRAHPTSVIA